MQVNVRFLTKGSMVERRLGGEGGLVDIRDEEDAVSGRGAISGKTPDTFEVFYQKVRYFIRLT